jgi:steroid Delta-isomerase
VSGVDRAGLPAHVAQVVDFFESISPDAVDRIAALYAPDAWFKDPFNEVTGTGRIGAVFLHMFEQVEAPRFVVRDVVVGAGRPGEPDGSAFLTWDFEFRFRRPLPAREQRIHGCSHLHFDRDGRITRHRDYWDVAEELYEKLPLLGAFMRMLRRNAATPGG